MAVNEPIRVAGPFVGDGVLVELDFDFETLAASDVSVVITDADGVEDVLEINTDYTVTLNSGSAGGSVTLLTALATGTTANVYGDAMAYTRTGNIIANPGGFFPSIVNAAFDRVHVGLLQLAGKLGRAILLPNDPTTVGGKYPIVLLDGTYGWSFGPGAEDGLREDLADPALGLALAAFKISGAGSVSRSAKAKLEEIPASPEDFSGNPSERLLAALTAHEEVRLARGATYTLPTMVDASALNNARLYLNGATIEADPAFSDKDLLRMSGDSKIIGPGFFDGTYVDAPTAAYAELDHPGVAIYITGTGDDGAIEGVTFTNFQAGPILHDSSTTRDGFVVRGCSFIDNQKYTGHATNALVAMHGVSRGLQEDCRADTYNWKGFYFANGSGNTIARCHTNGGVVGHASHFLIGGSDNVIIDCTHEGVGFGVKVDDEERPVVSNFKMNGGASAIYIQSCRDFQIIGGSAVDPTGYGIIIDGANGPVSGSVIGFRASRSTPGSTANHTGVRIESTAAGVASGIVIRDCYFRNFLWGAHVPNSGYAQTDIQIINNEFRNIGQYGVFAYMGSGKIAGNLIEMDGAAVEGAVFLNRDSVTTTGDVEISGNSLRGCTGDNIQITGRLHHKSIRVVGNRSDGGLAFLNYNGNGNAADTVSVLEVTGNQGVGLTSGCSFTFNGTTATRAKIENNNFISAAFAPVANSFANLANVTNLALSQRGSAVLAAGTAAVVLPIAEPDASYRITLSGGAAETFSWAAKATGGFTINSSNGASTATVDWTISR